MGTRDARLVLRIVPRPAGWSARRGTRQGFSDCAVGQDKANVRQAHFAAGQDETELMTRGLMGTWRSKLDMRSLWDFLGPGPHQDWDKPDKYN